MLRIRHGSLLFRKSPSRNRAHSQAQYRWAGHSEKLCWRYTGLEMARERDHKYSVIHVVRVVRSCSSSGPSTFSDAVLPSFDTDRNQECRWMYQNAQPVKM
ncbi:hypothetical protein LshimejAT787_1901300 [Lyophyllum shimeji]|uniref:Uncharacterized protein n=1 Tax=Lyophyllum shimeji TaxID=47721 RepID=A0A9P3PXW4_LYOSH|nr:hypothetical protein LshimejAT787_1901300 [Lyophyllum shimeji]